LSGAAKPLWLRLAPAIFLLLWSGGFSFAKFGLENAEPITFLALRYALVLAVLLPLLVVLRPPLPKRGRDWGHLVVVGFLIQAVYFGLSYYSFYLGISAGGVALIVALQPILVALIVPWSSGEKVPPLRWLGLLFGLGGAGLVIASRYAVEVTSLIGILAAVGALLGITVATLYEKRFGLHHHPVTSNAVQYAVGFAAVLPLAFFTETMQVDWTPQLGMALAYLVVGNSLISVTLLLAMVRHGEASRVSALFFLVPPMAALMAWGLIGEVLPPLAWAGMALAACGVALVGRPGPRARRV
jgi:drug/metabolite transporter (DMT)-like permease